MQRQKKKMGRERSNMISVAMATYNGAEYLDKQIKSICEQSVLPDEIVFSDDNSNDDTVRIIELCKKKYPKINFKIIINSENLGYTKNFIKAINNCSGNIVFLSDQDDIWEQNKIEEYILAFNKYKNINLIFSNLTYIDKSGIKINKNHIFDSSLVFLFRTKILRNKYMLFSLRRLLRILNITGMTFAFKNKYINIPNDNIPHDVLISYLYTRESKILYINEKYTLYRLHGKNTTGIAGITTSEISRLDWLNILFNNQKNLLKYEKKYFNNKDNIDILNKFINYTDKRINNLKKFNLFNFLYLLFNMKYSHGLKSLLGDFLCIRRKTN